MITVSIQDLLNGTDELSKLAKVSLKAKLAWQVARMLKAADAEIQAFNDARMELIKKYGTKDENGELITDENGNCKILEESVSEFSNELNELVNTKVEINANKIDINDLANIDFTPSEINALEPFIDFE
jgi:hypothetical protein